MKNIIISIQILLTITTLFFLVGCSKVEKNPDKDFDKNYSEPSFEKEETNLLLGN